MALGVCALVAWLGFFYVFYQYDVTRPALPDANSGRVYAQNDHGYVVYLTKDERRKRDALALVAVCLFGAGLAVHVLLVEPLRLAKKKEPWEIKRW